MYSVFATKRLQSLTNRVIKSSFIDQMTIWNAPIVDTFNYFYRFSQCKFSQSVGVSPSLSCLNIVSILFYCCINNDNADYDVQYRFSAVVWLNIHKIDSVVIIVIRYCLWQSRLRLVRCNEWFSFPFQCKKIQVFPYISSYSDFFFLYFVLIQRIFILSPNTCLSLQLLLFLFSNF